MTQHEDFPKSELDFHARFATEEACIFYLFSIRWPDGFVWPKCGHHGGWQSKKRPER